MLNNRDPTIWLSHMRFIPNQCIIKVKAAVLFQLYALYTINPLQKTTTVPRFARKWVILKLFILDVFVDIFYECQKTILLRTRYLHQLILMIMSIKIMSRFPRASYISLQVTCKKLIEIVFVSQTPHQLTIINLVNFSQWSKIQRLEILYDNIHLLKLLTILIEQDVDKFRILIYIIFKCLAIYLIHDGRRD
jgi:hypothetical protein